MDAEGETGRHFPPFRGVRRFPLETLGTSWRLQAGFRPLDTPDRRRLYEAGLAEPFPQGERGDGQGYQAPGRPPHII